MEYLVLIVLGLSLGSFVNALVWRLYHQQKIKESGGKQSRRQREQLSIVRGRSMCMHCGHELSAWDLVPVLSWVFLRGKCRYCKAPIDDTPLAELIMPALLVVSYAFWPYAEAGWEPLSFVLFGIWAVILTCFTALALYDARWYLLPDRIVWPVTALAAAFALVRALYVGDAVSFAWALAGAATITGIFWTMSAVSRGSWIGWGDVKLALSLGLIVGTPLLGLLVIFIASVLGTLATLPQILRGKQGLGSSLPFGPHLLLATVLVFLFGTMLYDWYFGLFIA